MEREILPGQPRPPRPSKCNGDFTVAVPWLSCAFVNVAKYFSLWSLTLAQKLLGNGKISSSCSAKY